MISGQETLPDGSQPSRADGDQPSHNHQEDNRSVVSRDGVAASG
jgi:hypothetical protein